MVLARLFDPFCFFAVLRWLRTRAFAALRAKRALDGSSVPARVEDALQQLCFSGTDPEPVVVAGLDFPHLDYLSEGCDCRLTSRRPSGRNLEADLLTGADALAVFDDAVGIKRLGGVAQLRLAKADRVIGCLRRQRPPLRCRAQWLSGTDVAAPEVRSSWSS